MSHVRQQIRERVATTLTGLTTTGSRVYQSRVYPLGPNNLPGLLVFTSSESSEVDVMGIPGALMRTLTLTVEGYVKSTTNSDDTIDTICSEVETALGNDNTINSLAKDISLSDTEIEYSGEGEQPVGVVTMNFVVQYRTATNAPNTAL